MRGARCISAIAVISAAAACQHDAPLTWQTVVRADSLPGCAGAASDSTPRKCAKITLTEIVPSDSALARSVAQFLTTIDSGRTYPSDSALIRGFLAWYQEDSTERTEWYLERKQSVACNEGGVFGVESYHTEFTGGAHPSTFIELRGFNAKTGALQDWRDGIDTAAVMQLAEAAFRNERQLPATGSLNDAGWMFPDDHFVLPANGLHCGNSVILQYNPYEVGPYVNGPTRIVVSINDRR